MLQDYINRDIEEEKLDIEDWIDFCRFRYYFHLRRRLRDVLKNIWFNKGTIVDIGCAHGILLLELRKRLPTSIRLIGVDVNKDFIDFALKNTSPYSNIDFILNTQESMKIKKNSVDLVISDNSLHHFRHPILALNEIFEALTSSGKARLWDINPESAWTRLVDFPLFFLLFHGRMSIKNAYHLSIKNSFTIKELAELLNYTKIDKYQIRRQRAEIFIKFEK